MAGENQQIDPAVAQDLASLLMDLSHNKDTRGQLGRLIRKAKPESKHANAFADVDVEDRFEALRKEQEDRDIKRAQDEVVRKMNADRQALLSGGTDGAGPKYDEDTVKKIEKYMEDNGITSYRHGAVLYANENPAPVPPSELPTQHGTTWEFPEFDKYAKDPVRASREVAGQVIGEFMRKRA